LTEGKYIYIYFFIRNILSNYYNGGRMGRKEDNLYKEAMVNFLEY